jgi:hypothetical protein
MFQFKNTIIIFLFLFIFCSAFSQKMPKELEGINNEVKVRLSLDDDNIRFISLKYTPQTYAKKMYLDGRNDNYFVELKNNLETIFFEDRDQLSASEAGDKYEKDMEKISPKAPKLGDKKITTSAIYIFSRAESSVPNVIKRDIIAVFVVKSITKYIAGGGDEEGNRPGQRANVEPVNEYKWYSLSGTNLDILLKSNKRLKEDLQSFSENKNIENYDLRPVIIIPEYGISVISSPEKLEDIKRKFTNTPPFDIVKDKKDKTAEPESVEPVWECSKEEVAGSSFSAIKVEEPGKEYVSKVVISNGLSTPITVLDPKFSDTTSKAWSIKNLTNRTIQPDAEVEFDIVYKSDKNVLKSNTDVTIPFKDATGQNFNGFIRSMNANMDESATKKSTLFVDFSVFNLSTSVWLPTTEIDSKNKVSVSYKWNFSLNMGHKEIGYPFWTSANWNFMAGYGNIIKLGFSFPGGSILNDDFGPITVPKRRLHGVWGLIAEFDLQTFTIENNTPFTLGGYFYYGNIKEYSDPPKNIKNDYYYVPIVFQVWYPIIFSEKTTKPKYIFQTKLGFSYHQVKQVHITQPWEVGTVFNDEHLVLKEDVGKITNWDKVAKISSPYIKVDYINLNEKNKYGFSLQYSNKILSIESWLEFGNFLRLEGSYSKTFQKAELWENSSVFWISPRFYLPVGF